MKELEHLRQLLDRDIFIELYSKKWKNHYKPELLKSLSDIEEKMENDNAAPKANKELLLNFLQDTKVVLIEMPLDRTTRKMIRELLTLLYNWNKAFLNNKDFEVDTLLTIRLIDETLTIAEYLAVSKEMLRRLKDLSHFSPPIFDLSRHYLKTLLDKYNEQ